MTNTYYQFIFIMNAKNIGIGILVITIIGLAVVQFGKAGQSGSTSNTQTALSVVQTSTTGVTVNKKTTNSAQSDYKNGTYTASATYQTPEEPESLEITVTLDNNVVTDAIFNGQARDKTSREMQALFAEGFKEQVVGKPIDEIALTVVNGSSLTPKGFMDALQKVKQEAKA